MYEEQEPITIGNHVVVRVATSTSANRWITDYVTFMIGHTFGNGLCLSLDMTRDDAVALSRMFAAAAVAGLPQNDTAPKPGVLVPNPKWSRFDDIPEGA